jgi:hypothetical protein
MDLNITLLYLTTDFESSPFSGTGTHVKSTERKSEDSTNISLNIQFQATL